MLNEHKPLINNIRSQLKLIADTESLSEEFTLTVKTMNIYSAAIKGVKSKLEVLNDEFKALYDHNPIHHMESRLKTPASIYTKMQSKGLPLKVTEMVAYITDIAGVRVICNYIEDIYTLAELLLAQHDVELVRERNYISVPKENGYRSLHLIVKVPVFLSTSTEYVPVEIQIRTIAMDMWASLEHEIRYKRKETVTADLIADLKECADTLAEVDQKMQSIYQQVDHGNTALEVKPRIFFPLYNYDKKD